MRTKLDTIVEEEAIVNTPHSGTLPERHDWRIATVLVGKRIAERAFRHGVEQTVSAAIQGLTRNGLNIGDVQPAPAEEKRCSHCFVGCKCFHCAGDRRKGERRNAERRQHKVAWEKRRRTWLEWPPDRRSGKDRRK